MPLSGEDDGRLAALKDHVRQPGGKPVSATPLRHRVDTLSRLLEDPYPAARRMARLIARLKREGTLYAIVPPQTGLHRYSAALALTAGILPEQVSAALKGWPDTS